MAGAPMAAPEGSVAEALDEIFTSKLDGKQSRWDERHNRGTSFVFHEPQSWEANDSRPRTSSSASWVQSQWQSARPTTVSMFQPPIIFQILVHRVSADHRTTIMDHEDPEASLGFLLEQVLGPTEDEYLVEGNGNKRRGLRNWYRLNEQFEDFECFLSEKQRKSYSLIYDWWTGRYCDAGVSLASIIDIVDECGDIQDENEDPEDWANASRHLALKRWPEPGTEIGDEVKFRDGSSTYNQVLRSLYEIEFEQMPIDNRSRDVALHTIKRRRKQAAMHAWCQATAWRHLHAGVGHLKLDSTFLDDRHYRVDLTQAIETCSWLPDNREDQLPYYLWHRKSKRTMETVHLRSRPKYTCVSHTWGRWRKSTSYRLSGVFWDIPENSRFEVQDLPNLLDMIPTETEYVWFDLVCIPQDGSAIAEREIARQAQIFKGAEEAVAWINDVDDFTALSCTLRWLMLQTLSLTQGTSDDRRRNIAMAAALHRLGQSPSNLLTPRSESDHWIEYLRTPEVWFTSLWTLQELCLRPDMKLCSRDWTPLTLLDDEPIPISGIVSVYNVCTGIYYGRLSPDSFFDMSPAFWELNWWLRSTGLERLLELSRTDIMAWGDRRQCTALRAEAIMSALGVTEWYTSTKDTKQDMVLGKYPVAFVQELMRLNPGEFFCNATRSKLTVSDEDFVEDNDYDDDMRPCAALQDRLQGLTLPFSAAAATNLDYSLPFHQKFVSHLSLLSWKIRTSGEVEIPSACIIASSQPSLQPSLDFEVGVTFVGAKSRWAPTVDGLLMDSEEASEQGIDIDLQQWASSRQYEVHAVVCASSFSTLYDEFGQGGVRQEVRKGARQELEGLLLCRVSDTHFAKLGSFWAGDIGDESVLPEAVNVNWLVC